MSFNSRLVRVPCSLLFLRNMSSQKWSNMDQYIYIYISIYIYSKNIFKFIKKIQNFPTFQGLIHEINFIALGSFKVTR